LVKWGGRPILGKRWCRTDIGGRYPTRYLQNNLRYSPKTGTQDIASLRE
jgi:hypothetical protein